MMINQSTPINFNIAMHNDSQQPIKFAFNDTFNYNFINNSDRYSVSMTSLRIPTYALETFIMGTPSDYYVTIYGGGQTVTGTTTSATVALPADDAVDPSNTSFCNGGHIRYKSPQHFVDILSRTIYRAYRNYMRIAGDAPNISTLSITLSDNGSPVYSMSGSATQATAPLLNVSSIADISFTLSNSTLAFTSGMFKISVRMPSATSPNPNPYVTIFAGNPNNFANNNYTICLTEAAYRSLPAYFDPESCLTNNVYALPTTSFVSSFCNTAYGGALGTWDFLISSQSPFTGHITITADITGNIVNKPHLPPAISLDSTTKKLSIHYQSNWVYNGMRIGFSPKLYAMINLGESVTSFNNKLGIYEFMYPPLTSSSSTGPITDTPGDEINTWVQQQSTMYDMMNISRIVIKSYNLRCESEYGQSLVADNVLCDFKIDTDVEYLGDLLYTTDAGVMPWRRYRIMSSLPTSMIDLNFEVEYDNGTRRSIYISPGQSAQARLSFFKES